MNKPVGYRRLCQGSIPYTAAEKFKQAVNFACGYRKEDEGKMETIRKCIAECIGTFVLVFVGCGTAMLVGCSSSEGSGYLLTALAFGLSIVAVAYCVGNISGAHVNPAVSLAFLVSGELKLSEFIAYVVSQVMGAFIGSGLLAAVFSLGGVTDKTGGFGSNGFAGVNGSGAAAVIVEVILTFIFVMAILGVTSKKFAHGSFGGLVIGLTLTLVHIIGIGLTGTSVNPARSLAPAVIAVANGNPEPLSQLWAFILGPVLGACLAAIVYKFLEMSKRA